MPLGPVSSAVIVLATTSFEGKFERRNILVVQRWRVVLACSVLML